MKKVIDRQYVFDYNARSNACDCIEVKINKSSFDNFNILIILIFWILTLHQIC
jgi:hypothetical protein